MKPLTPEEQLQMQLDVERLKEQIKDMNMQLEVLHKITDMLEKYMISNNSTVTSHHELIKTVAEKLMRMERV